VDQLR